MVEGEWQHVLLELNKYRSLLGKHGCMAEKRPEVNDTEIRSGMSKSSISGKEDHGDVVVSAGLWHITGRILDGGMLRNT